MKLSQYDPQINRNILQGRVQAVDNRAAWGGDQSGQAALGQAMGNVSVALDKAFQQKTYDNVQDAMNEYNARIHSLMNDENTGLRYTMQGKAAEGMQAAYEENERKIRDEVMQKYNIGNNMAFRLFEKSVEPARLSAKKNIDALQRAGKEQYANNQIATDTTNTLNIISQDPELAANQIDGLRMRFEANRTGLGWDPKAIQVGWQGEINKMASSVLSGRADAEDWESVLSLVPQFRGAGADEATLGKFEKTARKYQVTKQAKADYGAWIDAHPEALDMTAEEAEAAFLKEHPPVMPSKANGTPLGETGIGAAKVLADAGIKNITPEMVVLIAAHETGGGKWAGGNNYFGIKWAGEGDYNEYDTWELEDGVAVPQKARFQAYPDAASSGAAYAKWLLNNASTEELKRVKTVSDLVHVMKSHGYFTDDEDEYKKKVANWEKEVGGPAMSQAEWEALQEKEKRARDSVYQEKQRARKERIARDFDVLKGNLAGYQGDPVGYMDGYAELHPEVANTTAFKVLRNTYARGGSGSGAGSAEGKIAARNIEAMIENGTIQNANDFRYAIENAKGISMEQYEKLNKYFNDTISGKSIDIDISKDDMSKRLYGRSGSIGSMEWGSALVIAKQQAAQFAAENKREATQEEKANMVEKALLKGTDIGKNEYSVAELRAKGIAGIAPAGNGYYRIIWTDGDWNDVFEDQTAELVQGKITRQDL